MNVFNFTSLFVPVSHQLCPLNAEECEAFIVLAFHYMKVKCLAVSLHTFTPN